MDNALAIHCAHVWVSSETMTYLIVSVKKYTTWYTHDKSLMLPNVRDPNVSTKFLHKK